MGILAIRMPGATAPLLDVTAVPLCPVCGAPGDGLHRGVQDGFGATANAWSFRRCPCRECGHVWLDPAPTAKDLPRAYADYPIHRTRVESTRSRPSAAGRAYHAFLHAVGVARGRDRLESFRLPPGHGARLLEVGCGNGWRLPLLARLGYEVQGQDVAPAAVEAATSTGHRIHHGELEDLGLAEASFDVVVMNHVLEHVRHPREFLSVVRGLLRPGGRLVSIQPNGGSRAHRAFGPDWVGLDPPRHLHAFTTRSAARVAREAGFHAVRVTTSVLRNEHWARESLARQALGKGGKPMPPPYARTAGGQLAALALAPLARGAGDEIVLEARR